MLINLLFLSFAAYAVAQWVCLRKLSGGLKKASIVSAGIGVAILLYTLVGGVLGKSLFPLVLLFSAPFLLAYVVMLLLINIALSKPSGV
mgnify:CR=1 FL=1